METEGSSEYLYTSYALCSRCTDSEDRIRKGAEKLQKALGQKQQGRLDSFFTKKPAAPPKRKQEDEKKPNKKKK